MKKLKCLLLAVVSALVLAGCNGNAAEGPAPVVEDTTPSITVEPTELVLADVVPGITSAQVKYTAKNLGDARVSIKAGNSKFFEYKDEGNGYITVTPKIAGNSKISVYSTVDKQKVSGEVSISIVLKDPSEVEFIPSVSEITSGGFTVDLTAPENVTVKKYMVVLNTVDLESNTETYVSSEFIEADVQSYTYARGVQRTDYKADIYCAFEKDGEAEYVKASVSAKTITDDKDPDPVEIDEEKTAGGQGNVTLYWTNPSDGDLGSIEIKAFKKDTEEPQKTAVLDGTNAESVIVPSKVVSYVLEGLDYSSEYVIKITAIDVNGNRSEVKSVEAVTEDDRTPPAKVSGLSLIIDDSAAGKITAEWDAIEDLDFDRVVVKKNDVEISYTSVLTEDGTVYELTADSGDVLSFVSQDLLGNKAEALTVTVPSSDAFGSFDPARVSFDYTDSITVSGCAEPSAAITDCEYSYMISVKDVESGDVKTFDITDSVVLNGMESSKEYMAAVITVAQAQNCVFEYTSAYSALPKTKVIIWELHNSWNGNGFVAPYIYEDGSRNNYNLVLAANTSTEFENLDVSKFKYNAFIVHPALDGNPEHFSLEATKNITGERSGLYMTVGKKDAYTADYDGTGKAGAWGYSYNDAFFVAPLPDLETATEKQLEMFSMRKYTVAREAAVPENSGSMDNKWYGFANVGQSSPNDMWSSCANFCVGKWDLITEKDYYNGSYYIVKRELAGGEGNPADAEISVSDIGEYGAKVSYSVSAPDVKTITVSFDGEHFNGTAVESVSIEAPRINTGVNSVVLENLKSATSYTVTVTQVTASGKTTVTTDSFTTLRDVTATGPVEIKSVKTGVTAFVLSWNEPEDFDYAKVSITPYVIEDETETAQEPFEVNAGTTSTSYPVTAGNKYKFKFVAYDNDGNASEAVISEAFEAIVQITELGAYARFSGEILVTFGGIADGEWEYKVACSDGTEVVPVDVPEENVVLVTTNGSKKGTFEVKDKLAQFKGLTKGTEYTFTVKYSDDGFETEHTSVVKATAKRYVEQIGSIYVRDVKKDSGNVYLESSGAGDLLFCQNDVSGGFSSRYVFYPALDGSIYTTHTAGGVTGSYDTFSIEGVTNGGKDSGKYVYFYGLSDSATELTACGKNTVKLTEPASITEKSKAVLFFGYSTAGTTFRLKGTDFAFYCNGNDNSDEFKYIKDATSVTCEDKGYAWFVNKWHYGD